MHLVCLFHILDFWKLQEIQSYGTLRHLKLGMCYVDKGKPFTVGSCNYKVVFGLIWVFNPSKEKEQQQTWRQFFLNIDDVIVFPPPHSPPELCVSDQYSGIADIFAELPYWYPGEDFRVTVLELIEEADVCVRVASFLQVCQIRPTRLGGVCIGDLVEVVRYIWQGETYCCQNGNDSSHSSTKFYFINYSTNILVHIVPSILEVSLVCRSVVVESTGAWSSHGQCSGLTAGG